MSQMNIQNVLVFLVLSMALMPFIMAIGVLVLVMTCSWSKRIRQRYVELLLKIFQYGKGRIEIAEQKLKLEEEYKQGIKQIANGKGPHKEKEEDLSGMHAIIKSSTVINKDDLVFAPNGTAESEAPSLPRNRSYNTLKQEFALSDCLDYINAGVEAIIEDEVTQRFIAEDLKSWNMLTRTNRRYEFISIRLTVIWIIGFFFRYLFLLPSRVFICFLAVIWLTMCTGLVGCLNEGPLKRSCYEKVSTWCFNFLSCALSAVIKFHNKENIPKCGICVANHTTPIDVMVLHCDNAYALIGQRHGGFLGIIQRALARASSHIWFERSEVKDRETVAKRLREHVEDPDKLPILIFPEGTCINNTSVMQFKKGSFEVGSVIYPVAIKYDPRFTDAFWDSSRHSMLQYLYMMMSSWSLVCDVWYLPPMNRRDDESAIDFANRVKAVIAKQGGLVDLAWDGQLKRMKAKKEWKQKQQEEFSKRLKVE